MNKELLMELYRRQSKIIFGYLIKCGCRREEAEDIVQESFVKAIEYMDGVSVDKLSSWLFRVAINRYKNMIKKKSVSNQLSIDGEEFFKNLAGDEDIVNEIIENETALSIKQCLGNVKEEFRMLLIFKYEMELSYKEIGRLTGLTEDTVKTYLYRARNEFKRIWRENYGQ